jgi:hypothetical protein
VPPATALTHRRWQSSQPLSSAGGDYALPGFPPAVDLYGLSDVNPAKIDLTVPKRYRLRRREAPGSYRFHHEDLDRQDVTLHEGLPIVTVAKAIRQSHAASMRRDLLRQALEDAKRQGLLTRAAYGELMHELQFDAATAPTR